MAALVGGGARAKPGEVSLAHRDVLFLDELAEFAKPVLDALRSRWRQAVLASPAPITMSHSRGISAGCRNESLPLWLSCDPARPVRGRRHAGAAIANAFLALLDRFDLIIELPEVDSRLLLNAPAETSGDIAARVREAARFASSLQATVLTRAHLDSHLAPAGRRPGAAIA